MKKDRITFTTYNSLREIKNILNNAESKYRAEIMGIDDPFVNVNDYDIAVGMTGSVSPLGIGTASWGIEIYVSDLGNYREVEMIALGDGIMQKMSGDVYFDMRYGKKRRDAIADMLS